MKQTTVHLDKNLTIDGPPTHHGHEYDHGWSSAVYKTRSSSWLNNFKEKHEMKQVDTMQSIKQFLSFVEHLLSIHIHTTQTAWTKSIGYKYINRVYKYNLSLSQCISVNKL